MMLTEQNATTPAGASAIHTGSSTVDAGLQTLSDNLKNSQFQFTLAPDASTSITLPPPPTDKTADMAYYQSVVSSLTPDIETAVNQYDPYTFFMFQGQSYDEFLKLQSDPSTLYQIQDELHHLVETYNREYQAQPLYAESNTVKQVGVAPTVYAFRNSSPSVYPSLTATDAFMIATLLGWLDTNNEAYYQTQADSFVNQGVMYGWYSKSTIDVSRSLVQQYFSKLNKNDILSKITD
jgi:hypothetical protein